MTEQQVLLRQIGPHTRTRTGGRNEGEEARQAQDAGLGMRVIGKLVPIIAMRSRRFGGPHGLNGPLWNVQAPRLLSAPRSPTPAWTR